MKIRRKIIFLFLVGAVLFSAGSLRLYSQPLELEDFVSSALENNFSLRRAQERARSAAGAKSEALGSFFPAFSASWRGTYTDTVPEMDFIMPVRADPVTGELYYEEATVEMGRKETYSAQLQMRQPLFTFGLLRGGYAVSSHIHQIQDLHYYRQKDLLEGEVKQLFYTLLLAREMVNTAQKQKALMEENLETTRALYNAGRVSNLDVNRVRSHLLRSEDGLEDAKTSLQKAREALFNIAVIEDTGRQVSGELEYEKFDISPEEVLEQAMENRRELEMARLNVNIAQRQRKMELAQNLPRVYGFASYNFDRPDRALRDEWGESWVVGGMIELSLPPVSIPGQMKKVNARLEETRAEEENIRRGVELQVKNIHRDVSRAQTRVSLMKENLQITSENLDTARRHYNRGQITNIELNEAILDYTSARREYSSAAHDFLAGLEDLRVAAGGSLP